MDDRHRMRNFDVRRSMDAPMILSAVHAPLSRATGDLRCTICNCVQYWKPKTDAPSDFFTGSLARRAGLPWLVDSYEMAVALRIHPEACADMGSVLPAAVAASVGTM